MKNLVKSQYLFIYYEFSMSTARDHYVTVSFSCSQILRSKTVDKLGIKGYNES